PSDYFSAVRAAQSRAPNGLPIYGGESLNSYNLFWFLNPRAKQAYRAAESRLLAIEQAAALQSLNSQTPYPAEALQRAWLLLMLNSDRALLWGNGAGDPFYGAHAWSAADRSASLNGLLDRLDQGLGSDHAQLLVHPSGGPSSALVEAPSESAL